MISYQGVDASVSIQEREDFLHGFNRHSGPASVLVATCDRVEVYGGEGACDPSIARHLFRVVCGLESPMLGENQIQGQIKRSYQEASLKGGLSSGLHRLFQAALRTGKLIRTQTALGRGASSHAQAVLKVLKQWPQPLGEMVIVVIGINKMSRGLLKYLVGKGNETVLLGNRTYSKAAEVCRELGSGQAFLLSALPQVLARADVVISATAAPHYIVRHEHLPAAGGPLLFIDLAVPRDIDPAVEQRPGVKLYNVEDLEVLLAQSRQGRESQVAAAEALIDTEVEKFCGQGVSLCAVDDA